ncbi:MAG: hypothetical protein ACXQTI_08210 [Candidatus Nezhaarchaeales archaeon]
MSITNCIKCQEVFDSDFQLNSIGGQCICDDCFDKVEDILIVKRVIYGKASTPAKDREYSIGSFGAVGNKEDWIKYADDHNFKEVFFAEHKDIEAGYISKHEPLGQCFKLCLTCRIKSYTFNAITTIGRCLTCGAKHSKGRKASHAKH